MSRPCIVGLTGGIGSGKSTVSALFADLSVAIIDTDLIARDLTAPGGAAIAEIVRKFGHHVLTEDGALDRAAMRAKAFNEHDGLAARHALEAIMHPLIRQYAIDRIAALSAVDHPYAVLVVPLLFEAVFFRQLLSKTLVVDCAESVQLARIMGRDGMTRATAQSLIKAQTLRAIRLQLADDVIENAPHPRAVEVLQPAVDRLHARYLSVAGARNAGSAIASAPQFVKADPIRHNSGSLRT